MSDYRVDIKVRNNNILKKLEECGYKSVGEFCRLNDKMSWVSKIGDLVNMKISPLSARGGYISMVHHLCEELSCMPEDLFSDVQMQTAIETNKRHIEVGEAEMRFMLDNTKTPMLLEDETHMARLPDKISQLLETLTPREAKIISMRFGVGEYERSHTLREIGKECDVSSPRIRDIEAKALRKLRHPSRAHAMRDYQPGASYYE